MNIFQTIRASIYNPQFYREQRVASMGKAFRYILKLTVLEALIFTIVIGLWTVPLITHFFSPASVEQITSSFPQELQVTIKKGQVSTNVSEPYFIAVPPSLTPKASADGTIPAHKKNLVTINTQIPATPEDFIKYDTFVLISKDYLIMEKKDGEISIQKLDTFPDVVIDRAQITRWTAQIQPYFKFIIPFLLLGVFVAMYIFNFIGTMLAALIGSLIAWIVLKIRKDNFTFGQVFHLALYAMTVPILLGMISTITGLHLPYFIGVILLLIVFFVNTETFKKKI